MSRFVVVNTGLNRKQRRAAVAKGVLSHMRADEAGPIMKPYCIDKRKIKLAVGYVAGRMREQLTTGEGV